MGANGHAGGVLQNGEAFVQVASPAGAVGLVQHARNVVGVRLDRPQGGVEGDPALGTIGRDGEGHRGDAWQRWFRNSGHPGSGVKGRGGIVQRPSRVGYRFTIHERKQRHNIIGLADPFYLRAYSQFPDGRIVEKLHEELELRRLSGLHKPRIRGIRFHISPPGHVRKLLRGPLQLKPQVLLNDHNGMDGGIADTDSDAEVEHRQAGRCNGQTEGIADKPVLGRYRWQDTRRRATKCGQSDEDAELLYHALSSREKSRHPPTG